MNENRAIVSEIAGTTRHTNEEIININGILFRLIDTAGIREHTTDVIENMGVIKSLEKIKEADIVLYLFDVNTTGKDELQIIKENLSDTNSYRDKQLILVGNKSDIIKAGKNKNYEDLQVQFISAKENTGIEELKNNLFLSVTENNILTESVIVTNSRHYEALQQIEKSLIDIKKGLENKISGDLLALDIRHCLHYLGEITGEITNEDRLDYIFSKFCIGK